MPATLSPSDIKTRLEDVPEWKLVVDDKRVEGDSIVRTFTLGNFVEAVEFVNQLTELAEDANHHPDVDIRWNKVTLRLSTHSKGGLTKADFDLAAQIDML
ncbi:MAG: 4a-hydroxytetrahydrobiopterin dehydratase [Chthoniobacterales bacterium]